MGKKLKTHITIPVFYHHNDEGRVILDNEYMRDYFEHQLKRLYLETKIGMEEFRKQKVEFINKNNNENE